MPLEGRPLNVPVDLRDALAGGARHRTGRRRHRQSGPPISWRELDHTSDRPARNYLPLGLRRATASRR